MRRVSLGLVMAMFLAVPLQGQNLYVLDLPGTPLGEFPAGPRVLTGTMTMVTRNGQHVLLASSPSEFLITLPQALPQDFTLQFDFVPKECCNPEDLAVEGTATMNRGPASAQIVWHRETLIVQGGGQAYQAPMPEDLKLTTPGTLTSVVIVFQGTTVRMYTNGRRLYTLSNVQFVRGRVLRIFLGGQDDDKYGVYLAGLRILGVAAAPTVIAANPPAAVPPAGQPLPPAATPAPAPAPAPPTGPVPFPPPQPPPPTVQPGPVPIPSPTPPAPPPAAGTPVGIPPGGPGRPTPTPVPPPPPPPVGTTPTGPGGRPTPTPVPPPPPPPSNGAIQVGTGISDITGPIAEVGMMGYANFRQKDSGLHMRLFARAFVFADQAGKKAAFVSTDLGMIFSSVKQGVLKQLALKYPGVYDDRNVMLAATHNHSGPGGFSHHALYNMTTLGHIAQNYAAIVAGITEAIVQANDRLGPATLTLKEGTIVATTNVNRSTTAYTQNPEAVGANAIPPVETAMTVLGIRRAGAPIGVIAWFPVHGTSIPQSNLLVTSDNKGMASYLFEKAKGSIAPFLNPGGFVAAFPNGAEGDQSPNLLPTSPEWTGPGGSDYFLSAEIIGQRQYATAEQLFNDPYSIPVTGGIDSRHAFVTMPNLPVTGTTKRNGMGTNTLCKAAMGLSFAAGAEDGRAGMGVSEGETMASATSIETAGTLANISASLPPLLAAALGALQGTVGQMMMDLCQLPKPILIPTGALGWTPEILPFQILRIGPLAIVGIPGEMTLTGGRRLRARLTNALVPAGVQRVVLTGLANEYSGYITTPEEYDAQQYEGASTLYGRLTFDAYLQIFGQLADAMASGQAVSPGLPPPDLGLAPQMEFQTGVMLDDKLSGELFGQVLVEPPLTAQVTDVVVVTFRSGHPKNDLRRNDTYLKVERDAGGGNWDLVAWDAMPETKVVWWRQPACCALSTIEIHWKIPRGTKPGTYRISHFGKWKDGLTGDLMPYQGTSRTFTVQ